MSPRSPSENAKIRQETKKKIATAAFALIAEQGFEGTSMADIAKSAGVSKGLLYNHYESKEQLFQELVTEGLREGENILPDIMSSGDPKVILENIIRWFFRQLREQPQQWRLMTEVTLRLDRYPFMQEIIRGKLFGYIRMMEGLFQQLGYKDPLGEARILAGLFDGIGIQAIVVRDAFPLEEFEAMMLEKYCKHV
jgi:AcrR family transcriptional regulator